MTFNGLPPVTFDAAALNALIPFAGGEEGEAGAEELAAMEPAAGEGSTSCWGEFDDATAGGSVTYNLSANIGSLMEADGC
mgnify:CR=1 FL=1